MPDLADLLFGPGAVQALVGDERRPRQDRSPGLLTVDAVTAMLVRT